jgi:hypothetical protein
MKRRLYIIDHYDKNLYINYTDSSEAVEMGMVGFIILKFIQEDQTEIIDNQIYQRGTGFKKTIMCPPLDISPIKF